MLTAFFLKDELNGRIVARSNYEATPTVDGNYVESVSDPRPRVMWSAGMDNLSYAASFTNFCVDQQSRYIELSSTEGGSITTITVPYGSYTGAQLAAAITTQLAASTYSGWSCGYDVPTGTFTLGGIEVLYVRWKSGTHGSGGDGTNMGAELGFDTGVDNGPTTSIYSDESRWGTHTWVSFDLGASTTVATFLCDLYAGIADAADTSNITMYGDTSLLTGDLLANAQSGANYTLPFSTEPSDEENKVRVAYHSSGEAKARYWLFSWRHFDEETRHSVKIVRGMRKTSSFTRTVTTLRGHGLVSAQRGLGINNYYPVENLRRWSLPLAFDSWGEVDYRNVIHEVVRYGKQDGLLWALRWDDILSGAVNPADEANRGFLVYAALHDYSRDTYVGQAAEYLSGELKLEQVR